MATGRAQAAGGARRAAMSSRVDALADSLLEEALSGQYDVARHSLRSALRTLQGEGIVQIEPNRGARVKSLSPEDVRGLSELRIALEVESARIALERGGGRLPNTVHAALAELVSECRRSRASWGAVAEAHEALHHAIVLAAESTRLADVHRQAGAELRLFVLQLPPSWTLERIAGDHTALVRHLEAEGAEALRPHIEESTRALLERS